MCCPLNGPLFYTHRGLSPSVDILVVRSFFTIHDFPFTIHSNMDFPQTERTTLKSLPKRGVFDRELVYRILDEGFICHISFAVDGQPFVIPTGYARVGDQLYIHGSQVSRMLRTLSQGIDVCVGVTLVDGLVLARSAFHHSMNYRSVVIFGRAALVAENEAKLAALFAFSEHVIPGRWNDVREPTEQELKATTVLALPLVEVSAKVRTGPPIDDEEDYALDVWAGVLPLRMVAGAPVSDPRLPDSIEAPSYTLQYSREKS
jgi:nitroimidazol reductase NimA-like FMN-containing flavoprotein (pyridoxamine 5'-phosphate oxidase superfamily)